MKQINLKKSTESKCDWAVTAYVDWRNERLRSYNYDVGIYEADIENLPKLTPENLCYALCRFVPEVQRKRGEGEFPGKTLYQMVVALQKYLWTKKVMWDLVEGREFSDVKTVLDNVMRERTEANIGVVPKRAQIITYEFEEKMWQEGILGEHSPDQLRNTVLFLIGINVMLRAVQEHYQLRRSTVSSESQFTFDFSETGESCIVYKEDAISKTHDGGLADMRRDRKEVWIFPNSDNINRCPVRLIKKYLSLCPSFTKHSNFYLRSKIKPTPKQWYMDQVVGENSLGKVIATMMSAADIAGYFTNHSARRTGGTRLFRAGVERKLVKECTGHSSDAVDKYQITSDEQRQKMSKILACPPAKPDQKVSDACKGNDKVQTVTINGEECGNSNEIGCGNIGSIIESIVKNSTKTGKTVIKFQIEISHE